MRNPKVKSRREIVNLVRNFQRRGRKIVTINGSFDIVHAGHVSLLDRAKNKGDVLIVLLNSDKSIRSYKGPRRPINPASDRAAVVAALGVVDYITLFDEINPKAILEQIKPDIHCNGSDWGKNCLEREVVERHGGQIAVLKLKPGRSTTGIIGKILKVYKTPPVRAVFLDRDGTINFNKQGYIHKIKDFDFMPGAIAALKRLTQSVYKIIILTSQSGIGRGYYRKQDMFRLHQWMTKILSRQGVRIDKIYYCPHHPGAGCSCRKPEIGLLLKARRDFGISFNDSWVIGDSDQDVLMGREANVKTIKLGERLARKWKLEPNYYAKDLPGAMSLILGKRGSK